MGVNYDSVNQHDIRARQLLQDFFNEHGINPELHVWPDEGRGYIASYAEVTYPHVADIINAYGTQACDREDIGSINNAIFGEYEYFCGEAAAKIQEETKQSEDINDGSQLEHWLHTWEGKDGFYFCFSNTTRDGLYFESEDIGPFESRDDARNEALASIED